MHTDALVITGVGVCAPIGLGREAFWRGLAEGRHGMGQGRFETAGYNVRTAAMLPDGWRAGLTEPERSAGLDPCAELSIVCAREAWEHARLHEVPVTPERVALVLGTSTGGLTSRSRYEFTKTSERELRHALLARSGFHVQTAAVADALGLSAGPRLTVSTACTSFAHALAHAFDLLTAGAADVALVGGADALVEEVFAGFHAMGAMSIGPCAPFSEPPGMTVGEGGAFVVLERAGAARRRGVEPIGELRGYGLSADGHHATAPDPTGAGTARAIAAALDDAGATPDELDYVNAHGTGTEANDMAEWRALQRSLGARARAIPVSSTKGHVGHALGAAGAIELVATLLSMQRGVVPPTLHFTVPRAGACPTDPVPGPAPRPHRCRLALSINAAFGGANAALVLATESAPDKAPSTEAPDVVVVLGASALGAHGLGHLDDALRAALPLRTPVDATLASVPMPSEAARVPPGVLDRALRDIDPRGLDTVARYLVAVTASALERSGVRVRGALRTRAGLLAGASRLPWDSADEFWGSLRARGFARASAPAFARIVMNAAAGAASRALALRGPTSLIAGGPGSALQATALATMMLARRRDVDVLVAGAAHELGEGLLEEHTFRHPAPGRGLFPVYGGDGGERPVPGEGAACVVLARKAFADGNGLRPVAVVAGWGLAGPAHLAEAISEALARAGCEPGDVDAVYGSADGTVASGRREIEALRAVLGGHSLAAIPLCNAAPVLGAAENNDAFALVAAVEALTHGRAHPTAGERLSGLNLTGGSARRVTTVVVVSADEVGGSVALVLRGMSVDPR